MADIFHHIGNETVYDNTTIKYVPSEPPYILPDLQNDTTLVKFIQKEVGDVDFNLDDLDTYQYDETPRIAPRFRRQVNRSVDTNFPDYDDDEGYDYTKPRLDAKDDSGEEDDDGDQPA